MPNLYKIYFSLLRDDATYGNMTRVTARSPSGDAFDHTSASFSEMFNPANIVEATRLSRIAKAAVQKTGRLGFSASAAKMLHLAPGQSVIVFRDDGGSKDLFIAIMDDHDTRGFFVRTVGQYFYLNLKTFFDQEQVDYRHRSISYEITELSDEFRFEGRTVYRMEYLERAPSGRDPVEGEEAPAAEVPADNASPP